MQWVSGVDLNSLRFVRYYECVVNAPNMLTYMALHVCQEGSTWFQFDITCYITVYNLRRTPMEYAYL